jgi:predicted GIY-YIG superfamily endonuclease
MHWIYILKCKNNYYYVGETTRLYRRIWEHQNGNGGINTSTHIPESIVAIYKLPILLNFFEYNYRVKNNIYNIYFNRNKKIFDEFNYLDNENAIYDNLSIENHITECLMLNEKYNWNKIRGGKYIRSDVEYEFPINEDIKNLPLCYCKLPCDIKKNEEENYLYFRCAKKNMWSEMKDKFDIENEPCNFFMKYTKDIEYNIYWDKKKNIIKHLVNKSNWLQYLVGRQDEFCIGGCNKEYDEDNTIRYSRRSINLCFDCFINKNDELSKIYKKERVKRPVYKAFTN